MIQKIVRPVSYFTQIYIQMTLFTYTRRRREAQLKMKQPYFITS